MLQTEDLTTNIAPIRSLLHPLRKGSLIVARAACLPYYVHGGTSARSASRSTPIRCNTLATPKPAPTLLQTATGTSTTRTKRRNCHVRRFWRHWTGHRFKPSVTLGYGWVAADQSTVRTRWVDYKEKEYDPYDCLFCNPCSSRDQVRG